jgi:hypothetical protein
MLVDRDVGPRQRPLEPAHLRRLYEGRLDREFFAQRALPLVAEMRRAQHGKPPGEPAIEHFAGDHRRLDRLADADIVGDQKPHRRLPQRHDQRHELVRPRNDGDMPERAERSGTRTQAQPSRVEQSHDAGGIAAARPRLCGDLGIGESREPNALAFERQEQADLFVLRDCQRPEP